MCNVWPLPPPHCAIICSLHFPSPWGAPHRPLYHCMLQAATPLSILHKWTPSVQRLCIRKKFIFRTTLKIGSLFMTPRIRLFIFPLTLSGNVNVLGVGSGSNIQDFVSGDNINQAWYGHAENSYVIFDWFWHPNVDWLSCCVQSWGNLVDIPRQWQKYSRGMAI